MLVMDGDARAAVDVAHLTHKILLDSLFPEDVQHVLRIERTRRDGSTSKNLLTVADSELPRDRKRIHATLLFLRADSYHGSLLILGNLHHTSTLAEDGCIFGHAGLKEFFHSWEPLCDIRDASHS